MAAWTWYGPGRRMRRARSTSAEPSLDPVAVPAPAVLVLEQDELAARPDACIAAGIVEEHEGEDAEHLGLVGHQLHEDAREADRLAA